MSQAMHGTGAPAPAVHRDYQAAKIGMWLFLFTEILLFGGLFILYAAYRARYPEQFHEGGRHLNAVIGVANTVILLTSSLAMAVSIAAVRKGDRRLALASLIAVLALGALFLVNKGFEWTAEIRGGNYPKDMVGSGVEMDGKRMFFTLYFFMTGLHGIHVIAGLAVLSIMLGLLVRRRIHSGDFIKLENSGLYWHLVDVIWIFLLPLFYLAA